MEAGLKAELLAKAAEIGGEEGPCDLCVAWHELERTFIFSDRVMEAAGFAWRDTDLGIDFYGLTSRDGKIRFEAMGEAALQSLCAGDGTLCYAGLALVASVNGMSVYINV